VDHALEGILNAFQIAFEGRLTPSKTDHSTTKISR
jgi:hypothetical protein